jgi:hypothetical protein
MPGTSGPSATPPPGVLDGPVGEAGCCPGVALSGASVTAVHDTGGRFTVLQDGHRADSGSRLAPHW